MSSERIVALGALAGLTIFLGLPLGRVRGVDTRVRAALSATATGILLFLLWDILVEGVEPVEAALLRASEQGGSWGSFALLASVFAVGTAIGLMGLVYYDRWIGRQRAKAMLGPGSASTAEFEVRRRGSPLTSAQWLAILIATGIGLHNFGEGLAIGQSAAQGAVSLAFVLVIGFGLHNATEGFGIVAPLSGEAEKPTWGFLALLGVIGGAPTFVGTLVAQAFTSDYLSVGFFALAAGSILYVVLELNRVNGSFGHKTVVTWALLGGLFLGFATDFVLEAAGG